MVFQNLVSWSLGIGFVIGFVANRTVALLRACWGKHTDARTKWDAVSVDPRWMAGIVAVLFLSWSVYQTQANTNGNAQNAAEAKAFAARVQACNAQLIASINANKDVSADNDRLSREERQLLSDGQRFSNEWIGQLINPPPEVAHLDYSDPVRQRYGIDVSRAFFDRIGRLNNRIEAVHTEQDKNERERPPLPKPDCGT